ncbi:hypothetical protein QBC33DRAFT_78910 [Phialemonium atrogriseum]|uniref:Uncharacterized protein n=1 Tax=Phialemonium atrogriseum TaxID=1093897 RepID=A0AAJ0C3U2_9PEZI|nr:uncharacterized protein QBC33DRAFT_78910 [Phialemonium atrogriseum]KAK1767136.1 hypothetical protein QBC33DRAFT_78910 [Phialemonium atrogriseum]
MRQFLRLLLNSQGSYSSTGGSFRSFQSGPVLYRAGGCCRDGPDLDLSSFPPFLFCKERESRGVGRNGSGEGMNGRGWRREEKRRREKEIDICPGWRRTEERKRDWKRGTDWFNRRFKTRDPALSPGTGGSQPGQRDQKVQLERSTWCMWYTRYNTLGTLPTRCRPRQGCSMLDGTNPMIPEVPGPGTSTIPVVASCLPPQQGRGENSNPWKSAREQVYDSQRKTARRRYNRQLALQLHLFFPRCQGISTM